MNEKGNSKNDSQKAKSIRALQNILEDPLKLRYLTKELFRLIDVDQSKYIDLTEMYNYMVEVANSLNCSPPDLEDVKAIVGTFDTDRDEKISVTEFEIFTREIVENMLNKEYESFSSKTKHFI